MPFRLDRSASTPAFTALSPPRKRNAHIDHLPMPFSVDHKAAGGYGFPAACRGVALWEMHMDQRMHLERVKNIKMGVDNSPPRSMAAGKMREEGRRKSRDLEAARIARENAVLMGNMYRMLHELPRYSTLSADTERNRANKRNVSVEQRELSLKRLNEENQKMLRMILTTGPYIDFSRFEKDWKVTQRHMNSASKMPWVVGELPDVPEHARKHFNNVPTSLAATASLPEVQRRRQPLGHARAEGRASQQLPLPERALGNDRMDGARQQVETPASEVSFAPSAGAGPEGHAHLGAQQQARPSHPESHESHPTPAAAAESANGAIGR